MVVSNVISSIVFGPTELIAAVHKPVKPIFPIFLPFLQSYSSALIQGLRGCKHVRDDVLSIRVSDQP